MARPMDEIRWQDLEIGGTCSEPGSSREYKTGTWRSLRPVVDKDLCIRCGVCWLFCPDAAINQSEDGHFQTDEEYCKGCGICARECPVGCITMVIEEE